MNSRGIHRFVTRWILGIALAGAAWQPLVAAAVAAPPITHEPAADLLWHAGAIGIFDREARDNFASVEVRWRRSWHELRPWAGLTLVDSGAWFTGAGLICDLRLSPRGRLTLGTGPFYYSHGKEDDDLGFSLEFYSFAELTWAWRRDTRLGLRLGHLSNAGLARKNPGTETLSFVVSVPIDDRATKVPGP